MDREQVRGALQSVHISSERAGEVDGAAGGEGAASSGRAVCRVGIHDHTAGAVVVSAGCEAACMVAVAALPLMLTP